MASNLSPEDVEALHPLATTMNEADRTAGELSPVGEALTALMREYSPRLNRLGKAVKSDQRKLKKMNRKTRAVAIGRDNDSFILGS